MKDKTFKKSKQISIILPRVIFYITDPHLNQQNFPNKLELEDVLQKYISHLETNGPGGEKKGERKEKEGERVRRGRKRKEEGEGNYLLH